MPKNENHDAWVAAIESAIELLKEKGWENDSTTYDVLFEGKTYPPKEVYRIAKEVFEKKNPDERAPNLGGGVPTNEHLQKFGFSVVKKQSAAPIKIDLNGKKIYKLSMGTLKKLPPYKGTKIIQNLEVLEIVLVHKNTGKGQSGLFINNLEIGDYVYITYGNQLGGVAKIASNLITIPDDFEDKNLLQDWNARKVEYIKLPHNKDARDLKDDQRFWLPSGNSTLYEIPDLAAANKLLFEPYYDLNFITNDINPKPMSNKPEEHFFNNYYEYSVANKGNIQLSTIENYFATLKNYLATWCEKVHVDYGSLIVYERRELYKAFKALNKNEETFSGMMRFQWYIHSLLPEWPLNQILYGPPGTGKTYRTKEMAVDIANPLFEINDESIYSKREQIVSEYERLVNEGQIVFTTFHQSMGYEDFIEGIKPETNEKGEITYLVKSGIFKQLCETAEKINESVEEAIERFQETILEKGEQTLSTSRGNKFKVDFSGGTTFRINPENSLSEKPDYPASIDYIKKLHLGKDTTGMYNPSYVKSILAHLKSEYGLSDDLTESYNDKDYVLIIDEINRGNVSSIFGELITLLEPDKRKGMDEFIEIKLPYSKDAFSVPFNLYIIGTMNTADRSVEALDTALRRRFSFTEVMPQPEVLESTEINGINLTTLLSTINKRIEVLLDRDHTIGHSYFLKVLNADKKEEKLAEIFRDNILPLLQEYFYGDYTKIGLVLGEGFIKINEATDINIFAPFHDIENEIEVSDSYEIIPIDDEFDITSALKMLLKS